MTKKAIPNYAFVKDEKDNVVLPIIDFFNIKGQVVTNLSTKWYKTTDLCHSFFDKTIVRPGEICPLAFLSGTKDDVRRLEGSISQAIFGT